MSGSGGAAAQLTRLVQLVAELTRRERAGEPAVRISELAERFGMDEAQVDRDIRTLTSAGDHADNDWLASLSVLQEQDRIALSSRGHYRRPVRLTPEELAAIQVGLALDAQDAGLALELGALIDGGAEAARHWRAGDIAGPDEARVVDLAHRAVRERKCLELSYGRGSEAAEAGIGPSRTVEVHQVVHVHGRWYLVSWCRSAGAQRHFRADRVLSARLTEHGYDLRDAVALVEEVGHVFRSAAEERDSVQVRFAPSIARWLAERYPHAVSDPEGGVVVTFEVSDPAWLVRMVLQYGPEAEVLGPDEYRQAMARAVA